MAAIVVASMARVTVAPVVADELIHRVRGSVEVLADVVEGMQIANRGAGLVEGINEPPEVSLGVGGIRGVALRLTMEVTRPLGESMQAL